MEHRGTREGQAVIHVLILLECVLLIIIGLGEVIGVAPQDQTTEGPAQRIEASGDIQIGTMRPAIVPTAAAAGPESAPSLLPDDGTLAVLSLQPPGADALLRSESRPEVLASTFGSGAMREADRLAIARELLGSAVDDGVQPSRSGEIAGDEPAADPAGAPLASPAKASPPKAPRHASVKLIQPVARPAPVAGAAPKEVVPPPKRNIAIRDRSEAPGEDTPSTAQVAEAQRLLTRLGYQVGEIDGVFGKRTELAIRAFQQGREGGVDGRISDALILRLRRAAIREGREPPLARQAGYIAPRRSEYPGWFRSVVAGYQRLVGHHFNSIVRPGELQSYCRLQSDTWVFDEGSGRFLHCGQVIASK
jgi:Putative peptidoglycan binding domain